jgi:hypothetical protein
VADNRDERGEIWQSAQRIHELISILYAMDISFSFVPVVNISSEGRPVLAMYGSPHDATNGMPIG